MAISKTEVINKALTQVGAAPIVNLTDDTNNARIVNRVYEISLKSVLSECLWTFATKRKLLAQVVTTFDWYDTGETKVYQRPSDVVRIFGTNDDNATWREEGDYIFSDSVGLGVRYVYYLDDPGKYSASFVEALVDKLASDIAYMVLNSATVGQTMIEKYNKVSLPKAMSENAQIGKSQYLKDDAWELAKYGNGNIDA